MGMKSSDFDYILDDPVLGIPDHPLQYRAIGVIQGIYEPLEGTLTKGIMTIEDNSSFEAVILTKAIASIKNHVDLNQVQNWVVYPHTIPEVEQIYLQIVGVFVPKKKEINILPPNYFSIRGEVIYSSKKQEKVVVKVYQNKSKHRKKTSFYKLELKGRIPDHTIKHFYSFSLVLEQNQLKIKNYIDLGLIAVNV